MQTRPTDQTTPKRAKSDAVRKAAAALVPCTGDPAISAPAAEPLRCVAPPVLAKGKGATVTDVDGNEYIDYTGGCGAMILGHADERVVVAINKACSKGWGLGPPECASEAQVRLAELVASRFASVDMVQFVSSPTEAMLGAVQLAHKHTGRKHVVSFEGCAHAGLDRFLGDTGLTALRAPFNNAEAVKRLLGDHGTTAAAVVVEPAAHSFGLVPPVESFLQTLRSLCDDCGALLIFDEQLTGSRVASGGAAMLYDVTPDLSLLGGVLGGGLPLAAYGGHKQAMKNAPASAGMQGPGQASGNAVAIAAGIATLQVCGEPDFYTELEAKSARLDEGLRAASASAGVRACHTRVGSLLGTYFTSEAVVDFTSAKACDTTFYAGYHCAMLDRGVHLPPTPFWPMFVSAAHTTEQIDKTIEAAHDAILAVRNLGDQ